MKKLLVLLTLTVVLLMCLAACGGQSAHTHQYGEWSTTKNATCIEEGVKTRYCDCGEKQSDVIPTTGHNYVDGLCECGAINGRKQIIVSNATASAGDTVNITVAISGNPGIASLILSLEFDDSALILEKITYNKKIGGMTMQPEENDSPVKLYWINALENTEGDFVLATLTFKISESAPSDDYDITLSYSRDNVYNIDEKNVSFEKVNGQISVQ